MALRAPHGDPAALGASAALLPPPGESPGWVLVLCVPPALEVAYRQGYSSGVPAAGFKQTLLIFLTSLFISLIVSESYFWAAVRLAKEACVAHFPTLK